MSETLWQWLYPNFAPAFDVVSEPAGGESTQIDSNAKTWFSYSQRLDTNFVTPAAGYAAMLRRGIEGLAIPVLRFEAMLAPSESFATPYGSDNYPFLQLTVTWPNGAQWMRYGPAFRWNWNQASGALQTSLDALDTYSGRAWQPVATVAPKLHSPSGGNEWYRLCMDFDVEKGVLLSVGIDRMMYPLGLAASSQSVSRPSCQITVGIGLGGGFNKGIRVGAVRVLALPKRP